MDITDKYLSRHVLHVPSIAILSDKKWLVSYFFEMRKMAKNRKMAGQNTSLK